MAIEVYDTKNAGGATIVPGRRLYLDSSRTKLVPAGDKDARYLYCTEKQAVSTAEYEKLMADNGDDSAVDAEPGDDSASAGLAEDTPTSSCTDNEEATSPDESLRAGGARPAPRRARKRRM